MINYLNTKKAYSLSQSSSLSHASQHSYFINNNDIDQLNIQITIIPLVKINKY